ncbi:27kDa outer membrane protein [Rhodovulum sp. P5]|uniref:DsbA family protein n=1 Tax=Rhodovulum sp. P5 TaxID=1564506 RepID=UPI0009C1AA94|nr:DsbA family protein [Rhodovulum sp. P5]ARE38666.1 27kDa outer membrane protein [Rhodovulum sp. P5]
MTSRTRRNLVWLGGIALAYGALSRGPGLVRRVFPAAFDFQPVPGLDGFRRIARGDVSAVSPVLIGLDPDTGAEAVPAVPGLREDLCRHLFGRPSRAAVPVAYFSDYHCRYCRVLTPLLVQRADGGGPPISITWHELPLLGASSRIAARAALAAGMQGGAAAWHARMIGSSLVPTPSYFRQVAEDLGLDGARLVTDLQRPEIDRQLGISRGLADLFGFPGTPALVVGRTAVLGRIEAHDLDRLIALEAEEAATAPCA